MISPHTEAIVPVPLVDGPPTSVPLLKSNAGASTPLSQGAEHPPSDSKEPAKLPVTM